MSVAASSNEEQILQAAKMYQDRPKLLREVINDIKNYLQPPRGRNVDRIIDAVLVAIEKHVSDQEIQTLGSLYLYHIARAQYNHEITLGPAIKNRIVLALLNAMSFDQNNILLHEHGFLTVFHIDLPSDLVR